MRTSLSASVGALMLVGVAHGAAAAPACLPPQVRDLVAAQKPKAAAPVSLYVDRSMSMAGYAAGATASVRPFGDLVAVLDQQASELKAPISAYAFGSKIEPLKGGLDDINRFAKPAAYLCKNCGNLESRIDTVLQAVKAGGPARLNVIVTDLWLDNKSTAAAPQVALGLPLRTMIAEGRAIAVIGVRAPFAGTIYDVPGVGKVTSAKERAWFAVLVGPEADVLHTIASLRSAGSDAFSAQRMNFSVFTSGQRVARLAPPKLVGGGLRTYKAIPAIAATGIPAYSFDPGLAAAQNGRLVQRYVTGEKQPQGLVWSGPQATGTSVWRLQGGRGSKACKPEATWASFPSLAGAWKQDSADSAIFSFNRGPAAKLPAGETYLVAGWIGARELQKPNPAAGWMREWSLTEAGAASFARARPRFFKALNLGEVARLMENAVSASNPKGRITGGFAFVVHIED